ncbi:hypothetical protein Hanom_Chr09g00816981 [Helianthus anomalus]
MAGQGIIPEFGFGANSNAALGEGVQNFQAQQIEETGEIEVTNTGGPRGSITRITQTATPRNNGEGPSNPAPPQNVFSVVRATRRRNSSLMVRQKHRHYQCSVPVANRAASSFDGRTVLGHSS